MSLLDTQQPKKTRLATLYKLMILGA